MVINLQNIIAIFNNFNHLSEVISFKELTSGHINDTFFIETKGTQHYVLQRINSNVFKNAKQLILNKTAVSEYILSKIENERIAQQNYHILKFVYTKNGLPYFEDFEGNFWNVSEFIEGSKTFEKVENIEIAYEGGKLFGDFLNLTNGMDAHKILAILPNFHEMSFRYQQFYDALAIASEERLTLAKNCIQRVNDLNKEMHILQNLKNEGKIPLRITHNDTKISNALFDKNNKGLCVIDTDTVMIGIVHYDFGDAVRTICNTANEDETNLSLVNFNIPFYKAFTKGFLEKIYTQLTFLDVEHLALAAKTITFIMGLRMLTDFLNNDIYYKTKYKFHNLDRAKNQFKLVDEMSKNFKEMNNIALEEFIRLRN
jgi:serine/threonine protein kinase